MRSTSATHCKTKKPLGPDDPSKELAGLAALDRDQLKRRWRRLYKSEPPIKVSRTLLKYAIAYALQEEALGGLKPSIARVIDGSLEGKIVVPVTLYPGTKLLRKWNGAVHEVEILQDGMMYRGERHRSLSRVAELITGTHRSGLLFFGLKPKARKRSSVGQRQEGHSEQRTGWPAEHVS